MGVTAVMAVPLGIGAALYLEEFADGTKWYNRFVEVNLQNLAAVPSIVYGLLAVAVMALIGFERKGVVLGGAIALALLILPVIIITTRESVRAVPNDIRFGSLALGATQWQTTWRQTLPVVHPRHRDRHDPRAVARHRRGRATAPARDRRERSGSTRPAWPARSRHCRSRSSR